MTGIALGFALDPLSVPLGQILPSRKMPEGLDTSRKFKQIRSSIAEIGLIEPLTVTPVIRKMECVELMVSANNLTVPYAEAMLVATPAGLLVDGKKPQKLTGVTQEQMAKMEREMANLQGQYKIVEQTYGQDVLNLVLARGYLAKLLENTQVVRYLRQRQPEVLAEFETIVQTVSLEQ